MTQSLERLRSIKSFPELVKYLRDELDWEFETEDVEDLTYEYSPAEFGLDSKRAAAIKSIKQLRPLVDNQPWGIFYLDFAGQEISVGALRGIFAVWGNDTTFMLPTNDWYLLGVLNSSAAFGYLKGKCAALGDEEKGGRLRFKSQYMKTLPMPDAPTGERERIAKLARETQELHAKRCKRVEKFLRAIGIEPAESSSRNPLEQPWTLSAEEFTCRARNQSLKKFTDARDETIALTERVTKIEREIDERVAALYGVSLDAK
jgi:hypothetical protein